MMPKTTRTACLVALAFVAPFEAQADTNAALYGTAIPEDAVFIRWLAPTDKPEAFGATFDAGLTAQADYVPVSAAALEGRSPEGFIPSRMVK